MLNVTQSRAQIAVRSSSPFFGMKVVKSELGGLVRKEINWIYWVHSMAGPHVTFREIFNLKKPVLSLFADTNTLSQNTKCLWNVLLLKITPVIRHQRHLCWIKSLVFLNHWAIYLFLYKNIILHKLHAEYLSSLLCYLTKLPTYRQSLLPSCHLLGYIIH